METPTKQKEGNATVSKKKGWQKWLSRIGHFVMYGGWILLLFVIVGIVVAVSTC